jgi:hypothetical protein
LKNFLGKKMLLKQKSFILKLYEKKSIDIWN